MNKLYSEIDAIFDEQVYNKGVPKPQLYTLIEDVAVKYEYWKNNESSFTKRYQFDDDNLDKWYDEFDTSLGRKYYTDKQLFTHFIENIYKKEK